MTRAGIIPPRIDERTVGGGRNRTNENFPVGSLLLGRTERAAVLAFYRFARYADDIADSPDLDTARKLAVLDALDDALAGHPADDATIDLTPALALRRILEARDVGIVHARDLLIAFRRDAANLDTPTWDDLLAYCRHSAAPVGRFLLDLHRESRRDYPAADALCAALQVLNHIQDVGEDHRVRSRHYIPLAWPDGTEAPAADLDAPACSLQLRACLDHALTATARLFAEAEALPVALSSPRLRGESAAILYLARALHRRLATGDPLAKRIRPTRLDAVAAVFAALRAVVAPRRAPLLRPDIAATVEEIVDASGSSFRLGLRCLPRARREAMYALYAFCRVLDDIADEPGPSVAERLARLAAWEDAIAAIEAKALPSDAPPLAQALAAVDARFGLDFNEARALIAGMRMDVEGPICAPDGETFALYCRRAAGSVGLLSLPLLGATDAAARRFAVALGDALQIVNIVRDVAEDAASGRCYLPRPVLDACGIAATDAAAIAAHPACDAARARLAEEARGRFAAAHAALNPENARALLPARLMMAVYENVLGRLEGRGWGDLSPLAKPSRFARLGCIVRAACVWRLPR